MKKIAGYPARLSRVPVGNGDVELYTVADLESMVDRGALLRGETEPPYWAHLWAGAHCLARYLSTRMDVRGRRVLDLGCGLGLTGIAAARAGARVILLDAAPAAIEFAAASARANGLACETLCADFRGLDRDLRFDLIVAAEVAYDAASFGDLAEVFVRHLTCGGVGLVADAFRIDTRPFYGELEARRLASHAIDFRTTDEGRSTAVRLALIAARGVDPAAAGGAGAAHQFSTPS